MSTSARASTAFGPKVGFKAGSITLNAPIQSDNFVEGVSGWRVVDNRLELYGGPEMLILEGTLEQPERCSIGDCNIYTNETKSGQLIKEQIAEVARQELRQVGVLRCSR